jgi:hypothetical protein
MEAGEIPARSRHCKRQVEPAASQTQRMIVLVIDGTRHSMKELKNV